jgi:hypothetical protein
VPTASEPPSRHTADAAQTREDLAILRPELVARYDAALAGARAAVLARLLGAVDREPLPGLTSRRAGTATFRAAVGTTTVGRPTDPIAGAHAGQGLPADRGARTSADRGATGEGGASGDGTVLRFPAEAAVAFARAQAGLAVHYGARAERIDDPGALVRLLWGDVPLAAEVDNSVANLALARAGNAGRAERGMSAAGGPDALGLVEQLATDGHPLHPCCRTRGGMSVADVLAYGPEHSPVIRLRRLRAPAERWYGSGPPVLLAHPWQAERLRERYRWLDEDGETGPVRPLMSLRTVAPLDGGAHVKTAVDVQMTSAVRTVSPAAVLNGPLLSALLPALTADLPLAVLAETTAGAVLVDGQPRRDLAFLTRRAPVLAAGETAVPLGVLGAVPVLLEHVDDAYGWWTLLCGVLFAPLMVLLERGVALEAHGQNTLVVLRAGRPVRTLYRDFGGVRVSARRLRAAGLEPPPLLGDLPTDDPAELRAKVAAAALGNAAADVIAAFARRGDDPARLWRITAEAIRGTGTADAPHLLRDPLPIKATTAMRLAADPLNDIWAPSDNPLAAHA